MVRPPAAVRTASRDALAGGRHGDRERVALHAVRRVLGHVARRGDHRRARLARHETHERALDDTRAEATIEAALVDEPRWPPEALEQIDSVSRNVFFEFRIL